MDLQDLAKLREEALALNAKGLALYELIHKGDEPYEKREQADAMIEDAGKKLDFVKKAGEAIAQEKFLSEGLGSLTAGARPTDDVVEVPGVEWKSFSEFLTATALYGNPYVKALLIAEGKMPADDWEEKLLQENVGAAGGFLVPIHYRPELYQKAYEDSIVRPRATIIPMTVAQIQMPSLDQTITPAAPKSAYFGGLVFYWTEEGAAKTEVDFDFKLIDLHVHEYSGWLPVTNRLIADSPISLEALIRTQFGKCSAAYEDWHYLNGSGVGQPQGVINAGATLQPNRAVANQISFADVCQLLHNFQPGANGVFVAHLCAMEQLLKMVDPNGNYMWIPNARDGMPKTLMGYPLIFTEKVPALGTKGDIGLYDFSYYMIGDREQPGIASSAHEKFRENKTTFRLTARIDGKPWLTAPIALMPAGASSISPFVDLDVPE